MHDTISGPVAIHAGDRRAQGLGTAAWLEPMLPLLVAALLLAFLWDRQINHDTAWYLVATRKWLDGARLYVDIYEVNPPLNFYFTVSPVLLVDATGMSPANAQYAVVCTAIALSLALCRRVMPVEAPPRRLFLLAGLAVAMVIPALGNIAQREQIMVILATPWLVMQLPREGTERPGVTAALAGMAALGICLKPFFLLIPAVVTLWQVVVARSLRPVLAPANLVMGCVGLAYVGAALHWHPEYFHDVIPVAQDVYGSITLGDDVARFVLALNAAPFVLFGILLLRRGAAPAGTGGFVTAALAGLGCYVLQWNGFGYHMIPFAAFATMAAVWVICRAGRLAPVTLAAAIALVLGGGLAALRGTYSNPMTEAVLSVIDPAWPLDGVITLSTHVPDGPPLAARLNTRWVSRYPHAWLVPGALNGRGDADCVADAARCRRLGAILDRTRSDYISDIRAGKPDLLVVNNSSGYIDDPDFSWYRFMAEVPGWAEALSDYRKVRSTPSHDIWLRCTGATGAIAGACMAAGA